MSFDNFRSPIEQPITLQTTGYRPNVIEAERYLMAKISDENFGVPLVGSPNGPLGAVGLAQ